MHKIDVKSDLWPKRGERLRYIWNSELSDYKTYYDTPSLTCGQDYEVMDIRIMPCKDQVMIVDDLLMWHWVDLIKFNYGDGV